MKKNIFATLLAALLVLALCAGCSAPKAEAPMMMDTSSAYSTAAGSDGGVYNDYDKMKMEEATMEAPAAAEEGERQSATQDMGAYGNHKIISTYTIEMRTDEFDNHLAMLNAYALELGGYVENSGVSGAKPENYNDPGRYANITFRIPSDKAEEFVNYANGTGEITYNARDTEDVTLEYYDSETRLAVLRTQLERLTSIMADTDNLADIIELEREIADVTYEIEQHTTELRRYDNLIDYTRVYVNISEERLASGPAATKTFGERVSEGFGDNVNGIGVFLEDAAVWLITSLPTLIMIAIFLFLIVKLVGWIKRVRKDSIAKADERWAERRAKRQAEIAEKKAAKENKNDEQNK